MARPKTDSKTRWKKWYERSPENRAKHAERVANWQGNNKEKRREAQRKWRKNNHRAAQDTYYRWKYGISLEEFENLMASQNGLCAICRDELTKANVDHCHKTGAVRGLLCYACNTALGFFRDDVAVLTRAVEYLNSPKQWQTSHSSG